MNPKNIASLIELTGTEGAQVAALTARFHCSEDDLVRELFRYSLQLTAQAGHENAVTIRDLLDQKLNVQTALAEEVRRVLARVDDAIRAEVIVSGLLAHRLAHLPKVSAS